MSVAGREEPGRGDGARSLSVEDMYDGLLDVAGEESRLLCVCRWTAPIEGRAEYGPGLLITMTDDDVVEDGLCGLDASVLLLGIIGTGGGGESSLPLRLDFKRFAIFLNGDTALELDGDSCLPFRGLGVR